MIPALALLLLGPNLLPSNFSRSESNLSPVRDQNIPEICGTSLQWSGGTRIVGGRTALSGEFPWQVSIRRYARFSGGYIHVCGGSIINSRWILTAAHCTYGVSAKDLVVVANVSDLASDEENFKHKVSRVINHQGFDEATNDNDISLIQLKEPLDLEHSNGFMKPVCLAKSTNIGLIDKKSVNFATVSGWGSTDEEGDSSISLLAVELPLVDVATCNATYNGTLASGFFCAGWREGGKDSCQGDSGGPMIIRDSHGRAQQIGIVSFGEGCARKGIPGVYTDVNYYLNWIQSNLGQTKVNMMRRSRKFINQLFFTNN